ncbi:cytochrome P450 [Microlunatus sp. GCM10028923]|uniref:cytochrome P450 family protein n=1 Tax=Microlunatus sp. GCM10028923 TaxID=3273400 RepID=UPI00360DEA16
MNDNATDLVGLFTAPDRKAFYADLAAAGPVSPGRYFNGSPVWLVTGYDESLAVLKDHQRFSNDIIGRRSTVDVAAVGGLPEDVQPYLLHTLGAYDPPEHARLRKLVSRGFTMSRVEAMRPRIQEIVDDLLDGWTDEPVVDAVQRLAYPLPIRVICELLGVPEADLDRWRTWAVDIVAPDLERIAVATRGLVGYMRELIAAKRSEPGTDVLSALIIAQEEDGDRLSEEELISLAITILLAGHETTVSLIGNGLLILLENPEQRHGIQADPDLIPAAVEEMLRMAGPAEIAPMRFARTTTELGGVTILEDDAVQIVYAAANRDPRRFDQPDLVQLDRADNPHLGFGQGIHYCLGAALARVEADLAFRSVLSRFPDLDLAVPAAELTRTPGLQAVLTALPVRPGGTSNR